MDDRIKTILNNGGNVLDELFDFYPELKMEYDKKLKLERHNILNKIFHLYPNLKKNKKIILKYLNQKDKIENKIEKSEQMEQIVEQIHHNGNEYYYDSERGVILDKNVKIVGIMGPENEIIIFKDNINRSKGIPILDNLVKENIE